MSNPQLTHKRIRIRFDADKWTNQQDILTAATPQMYRGNDASFEVIIYWLSQIVDLSNIVSLTFSIWTTDRQTRKATKTLTAADITNLPDAAAWVAGTAQHAAFELTGAEMNWALTEGKLEENFLIVLSGITNDTPGHNITYGLSSLKLIEDAEGESAIPAEALPLYYTQPDSDARFVPIFGDQSRWRWNGSGWEYRFEDGYWSEMLPAIVNGQRVIRWGDPKE